MLEETANKLNLLLSNTVVTSKPFDYGISLIPHSLQSFLLWNFSFSEYIFMQPYLQDRRRIQGPCMYM